MVAPEIKFRPKPESDGHRKFKSLGSASAIALRLRNQIKSTVKKETRSFQQILMEDFAAGRLPKTPGCKLSGEAKAMLFLHDLWRVLYISGYFYMMPFLALYFSAGVSAEYEN